MPLDPVTGTLIAAGIGAASQGANALAIGKMNKKTREWNEAQYAIQRKHALVDWQRQNEYNSPAEQMRRLKEAGLNPNLVYGKGADNISAPVRSTDVKGWNPNPVEFDPSFATGALSNYYDLEYRQEQTNLIKKQQELASSELLSKMLNQAQTMTQTAKSEFELQQAKDLRLTTIETAKAQLNQLQATTKSTFDANERAELMKQPNFELAMENVLNARLQRAKTKEETEQIKQNIKNLKTTNDLQEIDKKLREKGINPSDPMYMRVLGQALDNPSATWESVKNWFGNMFK